MKCKQCNKKFEFNNKSVRLCYFDKMFFFCSQKCYYDYARKNHLSYWQWIKKYYSLSEKQKKKYNMRLNKIQKKLEILKKKTKGNFLSVRWRFMNDVIWNKPIKPAYWFEHIMLYKNFNEFKKAVIKFLSNNSFNYLARYSFQFACCSEYPFKQYKHQKTQIKAINKVFDQIYGKNKVRWGFISHPKDDDKSDFFWGPYIVIDEETFFYYPSSKLKLDTFIRRKLGK